ncbi:MAG: glutathione S-transferase family protein [Vitreimonas sp.]
MEPILAYGVPEGSSMGLIAAFEWLGEPYKLCRVDMLGEMREASYARINPRHETPVLITPDGRAVSETMAIVAWLEARDSARRISFEPRSAEADRMHQLIGFINTGFTGAFSPLWTALETADPDPAYKQALGKLGAARVLERHDKLDAMIGGAPFLCGGRPTLADAVFIGVARWLDFHKVAPRGRWPNIERLRRRLEADLAVRTALAIEAGDAHAASSACKGQIALADVIDRFGS